MRELDDIDLLVICIGGLEPLQALAMVKWSIGRGADNLPALDGYRRHIRHPSIKWWIERNSRHIAGAMAAEANKVRNP